jgi:hypothetical protein
MKQMFIALAGVLLLAAGAAAQAPATAPRPRLISPVRGVANIDYTQPASKRNGKLVVTTIRVKNTMQAPIAGLKVDEFWYGAAGDPVGGGTTRLRTPLMPGDVVDVVIQFQSVPDMNRNSYQFSHANGDIKPTRVARLDLPKVAKP